MTSAATGGGATSSSTTTTPKAMEQFLILSKAASGRACVALIEQVISHPKLFVFSELLAAPTIKALRFAETPAATSSDIDNVSYSVAYSTLELFAFGNYSDYIQTRDKYLSLNATQLKKLKQLSLISLSQAQKILSYDYIMSSLDITSRREVEELVLSSIYAEMLSAKLDPAASRVIISSTIGRDVPHSELDTLLKKLGDWITNADAVCVNIDKEIKVVKDTSTMEEKRTLELEAKIDEAKRSIRFSDPRYEGKVCGAGASSNTAAVAGSSGSSSYGTTSSMYVSDVPLVDQAPHHREKRRNVGSLS